MKRSELSHPIPEPKPRPETAVGVLVEQFETGLITLDEFTSGVCSITMRRQLELEEGKMLALQFHEVVLRMRALMGMG